MADERSTRPADLLARIRQLEDQGEVDQALALVGEAARAASGGHDWTAERERLEREGKLARPYREGIEALREGDYADAQRLLSWVAGKNPRFRETTRYLYWAVEGRDPLVQEAPAPTVSERYEDLPPSLLDAGRSPFSSPGPWVLALLLGALGFGLGWRLSRDPADAARAAVSAAATPAAAEAAPSAAPEPAPAEAPKAEAPKAEAPKSEAARSEAPRAEAPRSEATKSEAVKTTSSAASGAGASSAAKSAAASAPEDKANQAALSCQNGSAHACYELADIYYYGRGLPRDLTAALRYYSRACEQRDDAGCYNAADMYARGEGTAKDRSKAISYFDRGCSLGDTRACTAVSLLKLEGN